MKIPVSTRWRPTLATLLAAVISSASIAIDASRASTPFLRRTPTVIAVENVGPSVVNITTETIVDRPNPFRSFGASPMDRFFRDFYGPSRKETVQSLGSGVIIDATGRVITNQHVIERADRIRVALGDGRQFDATLIGADPNNDLAVLQIESRETLPWTAPGTSSDLFVGEPVIAIGNPFGLENTVTTGVLSAVDRSVTVGDFSYHGFLQTDASINPGNSGGPLLNAEGTLIGINTAIYGDSEGINFAIPIDVAMRVVAELIEHGEVQPVWLGLGFQELAPALHEVMQLPEGLFGILVTDVAKDSPATDGELRRGDIMTRLDGRALGSLPEFLAMLKSVLPGQTLEFEVWRDSKLLDRKIVAAKIPERIYDQLAETSLGLKLANPNANGCEVTQVMPNTAAAQIGIEPGDLILRINGRALNSDGELRKALLDLRRRSRALVVLQRGKGRYQITIPLS